MVCRTNPDEGKAFVSAVQTTCFRVICSLFFMMASAAHADTVTYMLDNVILDDHTQMTGTFLWTYDTGDFENGVGQFTSLDVPHTSHDHTDLNASFDIGKSIEITLVGSTHDDGVDITLVVSQPLTPTTSSLLDLAQSKFEIGGNGFHTGVFLSGRISPYTGGEVVFEDGFEAESIN